MDKILLFSILGSLLVNICAYSYINRKEISKTPLQDIIHKRLPCLDRYYMNDVLTITIFIFALFNLNTTQLKRVLLMFAILYTVRAITMCVTHLPAVNKHCKSAVFNSCHDLMFSGHTTMTVISLLALHTWQNLSLWITIPYYLITAFFILAQRRHYTADVVIASVLSFSVFHNLK